MRTDNLREGLLHHPGMVQQEASDTAYLAALWDEPVSYVVQFAQALDSVTAGYFLSCYVTRYGEGEWAAFNEHTAAAETGLGRGQWYAVRDRLLDKGVLMNDRNVRASLYCLNGAKLEAMMRRHSNLSLTAVTAPPLSINRLHLRTLLHYGLSVKACLYLAVIQSETPHTDFAKRSSFSDWILLPEKTVTERSYLSKREQQNASEALRTAGLIENEYRGFPRMRYCRYSLKRLAELTDGYMQTLTI
ncbi:hypothetical protein BG910_11095 [Neisseria chenwenguii]|uniref:Uncharacterized protein n=1 Tax=Neisseria chenwenguii TaxID=1853278 RepID=A0A220S3Z1_9NEIS|nr:hypothetical protein [Neisseria chenwenguii]ASK28204.1 hypothetical protein BG910_11095 [Neisseria chenwenguii]